MKILGSLPFVILAFLLRTASGSTRRLRTRTQSSVTVEASRLHKVCSSCGEAGLNTLQDTSKYCSGLQEQCTCCLKAVKAGYAEICRNYMGFGGCIDGIKAAIAKKEQECKKKQDIADALKDQQKADIEDALGSDIFDLHSSQEARTYVASPYKDECAEFNTPNCSAEEALCGFDSGCDRQLAKWTSELTRVEDWQGMLKSLPCF
mmetsp:Transcript_39093/g.72849  ORF Transcript_39093/g.72849 Transcript_39093/m.72849 type:complete len:205 (+) Transcript_39093:56-670(+)